MTAALVVFMYIISNLYLFILLVAANIRLSSSNTELGVCTFVFEAIFGSGRSIAANGYENVVARYRYTNTQTI